ncbi:MAG: flagellar filament capping protein FliD [Planctomycetota bacterium]
MGQISSNTGLNTGIDITGTITKLMAISAKPRDALTAKNTELTKQQTAVSKLNALLLSFQYMAKNVGKTDLYASTDAASSDSSALTATVTGTPTVGTYQYTPLRMAQSQQLLSSGSTSASTALGAGTLAFRFGDGVNRSAQLESLNGGQGFSRGVIRITDKSGASAQVDLSNAQTVDDVLQAINSAGSINVTAVADDGHFRLIDNTGQSVTTLKVQEVGSSSTAASLGLTTLDASTGAGQNVLQLYSGMSLDALNDGAGVDRTGTTLSDIQYTLADGTTTGQIRLSTMTTSSLGLTTVTKMTTLGEVIGAINTQSGGKLQASIGPDGNHLVVKDTVGGGSPLTLSAVGDSGALRDLGLDATTTGVTVAGDTVTGRALQGGLKTVLLSSLNGGQGIGTLGSVQLTGHNGNGLTVDLTGSVTLQDVANKINSQIASHNGQQGASQVKITAQINSAGNGIQLVDTSGVTGTLTAANVSGNDTADKLFGTNKTSTTAILNSGDMHLRVVSRNTLLAGLNGGAGVTHGTFTITDSSGARSTVNLSNQSIQNVGDVIDAINRSTSGAHAELNATGDGISIQDTAHGTGTLSISEGSSTTAHDLHLLNSATTVSGSQVIDGSTTQTIQISATDTLTTLQTKINALRGGLTASILNDGSSNPYRLSLTSTRPGKVGNMLIDTSNMSLSVQETAHGQNALLALSNASSPAASVLIASATNQFQNVLSGVTLEIKSATGQPVTVNVSLSNTNVVANVQTFVDNYNKFRAELTTDTAYDATTDTRATLTGDSTALQLDTQLSSLLSSGFYGNGSIQSLGEVGITLNTDGTLAFNQTTLENKYAADPAAVKQFFTTTDTGVSAQFNTLLEQFGGQTNSLMSSRLDALQQQIDDNKLRIDSINARLTVEQNRLYTSFYNMDIAIGKLKNSQSVINSLVGLTPYTGVTTSG